jgi:hypothetical protein
MEVVMAALRKPDRGASATGGRAQGQTNARSDKIYAFAQRAYEKTGGPTDDLRRVYGAYLANQKKLQPKG